MLPILYICFARSSCVGNPVLVYYSSEVFREWKKVWKQHDSFLLQENFLPRFFLGKFTCETSTLDLQPFLWAVFFTSDQISELFSVIFIFLVFAFSFLSSAQFSLYLKFCFILAWISIEFWKLSYS